MYVYYILSRRIAQTQGAATEVDRPFYHTHLRRNCPLSRSWQTGIVVVVVAMLGLAGWLIRSSGATGLAGPAPLAPAGAPVGDKGAPSGVADPSSPYPNGVIVGQPYQNDVS